MADIATIVVLAITVEALTEYIKLIIVNRTINWKQVSTLIVGVALACCSGVDLFSAIGVNFIVPYVGVILTGIIFSRGSNYVFDFIQLIRDAAERNYTITKAINKTGEVNIITNTSVKNTTTDVE